VKQEQTLSGNILENTTEASYMALGLLLHITDNFGIETYTPLLAMHLVLAITIGIYLRLQENKVVQDQLEIQDLQVKLD
jgi:uncharacterized membrane protein (DUF106 family)